ncbi:hypothetical protein BpHYR1_003985 [Brachionus plicatilis]|uniref:Uncharacterized protein n=1 Tax=Brachionus plicatilis TaxID=10195 RepID=A0A3M7T0Q9_BRAPC|nr:hypothetical protein BpHYR1_003985 [Brachionus plicatilis]
MYLTNIILLLSCTILFVKSSSLTEDIKNQKAKTVFSLICSKDELECDLIENVPNASSLSIEDFLEDSKSKIKSPYQGIEKRFFSPRFGPMKIHKNRDINCLTHDCKWFMTKDKRAKNGGGTLTCLGDPYSNSGSRCVPIEGLYIG